MAEPRMGFGKFVDLAFWSVTLGVATYGANKIDKLNENVTALNANVAVLVERSTNQDRRLDSFESRVRDLELKQK